jgi:tRNA/rRNA methyltransferase
MGENIGAAARAMGNAGLKTMRLINPRDGWPSEQATAMSSGAFDVMEPVSVHATLEDGLHDTHFILATTAQPRTMVKPVYTPKAAMAECLSRQKDGQKTAILFGRERSGLTNDEIARANGIITIPTAADFSSLNLAQAVMVLGYEWAAQNSQQATIATPMGKTFPATQDQLNDFLTRLEDELQQGDFFKAEDLKPTMLRNIRNFFMRAEPTDQDLRTLHGIISALNGKKSKKS